MKTIDEICCEILQNFVMLAFLEKEKLWNWFLLMEKYNIICFVNSI
jgi:hypothetical protein